MVMIDFTKLIELYISRKNKYLKSEERAKRRIEYFKDISDIDADVNMSLDERRARKNSAAQKLTGTGLVSQEIVDYYYRHSDFINFETIAPIVGFWEQVLVKEYDEQDRIIKLWLDTRMYSKEIGMSIFSLIFFTALFFLLIRFSNTFINFMADSFYLSKSFFGVVYLILISPLFFMLLFLLYIFINLIDLKRLVK